MAKYIDAEKLLDIVIKMQKEYATQEVTEEHKGLKAVLGGQCFVLTEIIRIIDSLQQEEVDLEKEIDNVIADYSFVKTIDSGGFKTTVLDYAKIARHFYELGRKQVLQEIYDGKTKPVDKITAAWLDDKEEDK